MLHATNDQAPARPQHKKRDADDFQRDMQARQAAPAEDQQHDGLIQHNPSETDVITAAQQAAHRLITGQSWQDWVVVGRALRVGRTQAMGAAQTNKPEGRHYAAAFSRWLGDAKLDKLLGGNEHKALRCRLLDLIDHFDEVEGWRNLLPTNRRLEVNYPLTVWKHWQRSKIPIINNSTAKPSPMAKLKESVAALEEENQRLKELNGGNTFTAKDRPQDVVRILKSMFSTSKVAEIRRLLKDD